MHFSAVQCSTDISDIGASIRTCREILCLPYAGLFLVYSITEMLIVVVGGGGGKLSWVFISRQHHTVSFLPALQEVCQDVLLSQ